MAAKQNKASIFENEKVINDCIHGTIKLPPAILAIVNTPQFQRLRRIKQTGTCHLVYPNATHNRFQHSLGVGHIARKFAEELQRRHPDWVDDKDVLCVMMAGICHDLGHGPYSHLWESFVQEAKPGTKFHHEKMSLAMFDHLIKSNGLEETLKEMVDINECDLTFVKEQIGGPAQDNESDQNDGSKWPYKGRGEHKSFLYEIVANKETGIDVDKWDYLLRDDYYFKIGHVFNYERFITYAKVLDVPIQEVGPKPTTSTRRRIVLRDKEESNLAELCRDRTRLHLLGYQHRISTIADGMLQEAWVLAKAFVQVKGQEGKSYDWVSASTEMDMVAYEKLTDEYVHYKIVDSDLEELKPAQHILQRLETREFYKDVLEINVQHYSCLAGKTDKDVLKMLQNFQPQSDAIESLQSDEIAVFKKEVSTGTKFDKLYVYRKSENTPVKSDIDRDPHLKHEIFYICSKKASANPSIDKFAKAWEKSLPKMERYCNAYQTRNSGSIFNANQN